MLVYKQRPITGNHGWRTCCFFVFGSDMNLELCQPASTRDKTQFFLSFCKVEEKLASKFAKPQFLFAKYACLVNCDNYPPN
jgi:hypothetical protein